MFCTDSQHSSQVEQCGQERVNFCLFVYSLMFGSVLSCLCTLCLICNALRHSPVVIFPDIPTIPYAISRLLATMWHLKVTMAERELGLL